VLAFAVAAGFAAAGAAISAFGLPRVRARARGRRTFAAEVG
jgi:hypothetical protein